MSQDGSIGVRQPSQPDRQIDNGVVTRSGIDYYRQRLEAPNLEAVEGATADASVTGDSAGTNAAKLRGLLKVLSDVWNSATHRIKVDVENTVLPPGAATQSSLLDVVTAAQGARTDLDAVSTVQGSTADAAVTGDTAGSASAKLRGLSKMLADVWNATTHRLGVDVQSTVLPPGAATQASLLDVVSVQGATADAAVTGDTSGSASGKLRGLVKILTDVWSSSTHRLAVDVQSAVAPAAYATYRATASAIVPAASATDVFTITGSASKTIYVFRIRVSGTQTTGGQKTISGVKRSTANSGGTSTTRTSVPSDSNSAAPSATVRAYTANPTSLGTLVGEVSTDVFFLPGAASVADSQLDVVFGDDASAQPLVLRGTAETYAINFGGVTVTGGSMNFQIEWAEV